MACVSVDEIVETVAAAFVSVAISDLHVLEELFISGRVPVSFHREQNHEHFVANQKRKRQRLLTGVLDVDHLLSSDAEYHIAVVFLRLDFVVDGLALVGNFHSGSLNSWKLISKIN